MKRTALHALHMANAKWCREHRRWRAHAVNLHYAALARQAYARRAEIALHYMLLRD